MLSGMQKPASLSQRLLHEQVRLLASNVPTLVAGTLLLATGTAILLVVNDQSRAWVLGWWVAIILQSLVRWYLAHAYGKRQRDAAQTQTWARIFVVGAVVSGLLWGSLAWMFFTLEEPYTLLLIGMVLAALVSSATHSLGPYFPAHLGFAVPCLLPFALQCLRNDNPQLATLGMLMLVLLVMVEHFSRRISTTIEDALRLRFENQNLVEQVTAEKDKAEIANRAKTRFLATASHDMRQPIHAMSLFVPAMKRMAQQDRLSVPSLLTIAERMQGALDVMGQLLNRLLDVSRLDAGAVRVHREDLELAPVLSEVVEAVAPQCDAKGLRLRVHDGGLWVYSDPAVLHTILGNLLSNAARYTERGGILVGARPRGERVEIQIWDTGIGIASEDMARITEEFFQGSNITGDAHQARGFGLGMSIVSRSADLVGARLHWRSQLGKGSMFAVSVPRAAPLTSSEASLSPTSGAATLSAFDPAMFAGPAPLQNRTVLVVDGDDDILAAMSLLLRSWGHTPLLASSMEQAVQLATAHPGTLDAALVDFHLSRDINGLMVVERLREHVSPLLPMAIVTGDTSSEVMRTVREASVEVMHKPVEPATLYRFICGNH